MNQDISTTPDEVDLRELFSKIAQGKKTIFGFAAASITIALVLVFVVMKPTYQAEISFLSPSDESVAQATKFSFEKTNSSLYKDTKEDTKEDTKDTLHKDTKDSLYKLYLNTLTSKDFQRQVFDKGNYLAKSNPNGQEISDLDNHFLSFVETLKIQDIKKKKNVLEIAYENPVVVTMQGSDPSVISDFLNDLSELANKRVVESFLSTNKRIIQNRLEEIDQQKALLLLKAEKQKESQIKALLESAKVASKLGVKDNNFDSVISGQNHSMPALSFSIGGSQELPHWYLYGELALLQEIELLKNRENDDMHVPEIILLDVEKAELEAIVFDSAGISAAKINQHSIAPNNPIKPKKSLIVAISAIAGLIFGVFWVLISAAFRNNQD